MFDFYKNKNFPFNILKMEYLFYNHLLFHYSDLTWLNLGLAFPPYRTKTPIYHVLSKVWIYP